MIRPLRQRHHRIVIALGILLPVAFALGIAARRPIPIVSQLPSTLGTAAQPFENAVWQRSDLFAKLAIPVRVWREHSNAGRFAVSFSASSDFVKPDLLVYWSAETASATNVLPDDAILLGAFDSHKLTLPEAAEKSTGTLLLFSLADNEIVDVSRSIRINEVAK